MNVDYDDWHHRKTTCTFTYTKRRKKLQNVFIYKKPDTFQKIQKFIHLTLRDFHETFEVGIYIQKAWHFALRDVLICKKLDTLQKARQFAIRFDMQKSGTFLLRDFSLIFWNLRRGSRKLDTSVEPILRYIEDDQNFEINLKIGDYAVLANDQALIKHCYFWSCQSWDNEASTRHFWG